MNPDSPLPLPGPIGFSEISSALRQASKVFFSEIAPLKDKFLLSLQLQQFRGSVAELRSEVEARPNLLDRLAGFRDLSDRSQGFLHSSRKHDLRSLQDPHELIQTLQAWHRSLLLPGVPVSRAAEDLALIVRFAEGEKQNPQLAKWLQGQLRDTVAGFNNRLMKAKDYAGAHRLLNSVNRNFGGAFDGPLQDVCQRLIGQALELENDLSTLNPSQKLKALCQLASVYRQLRENPEEALAKHEERYRGILEEIVELGKDPSLSDGEKIDAMMLAAVSLGTAGDPARGRKLIVELHHSLQNKAAPKISPETQEKKIAQLEKTIPTFLWLQTLIESTYSARIQEEEGKKKSVRGLVQERQKIRDYLAIAHAYLRDGKASTTEEALEKLKEDFGSEARRDFYIALGKAFEFQIPMGEKVGITDHILQLVRSETIEDPRMQARVRFELAKRFLIDDSLKRRAEPLVLAMLANLEVTAQATSDAKLLSDIQDLRKLKPYLQATNRVLDHVFSIEGFGIGMASMFTAGLAGEVAAFAAAARFGATSVQALNWGQRIAVGAARFGANWAAFNASETMLKSMFHLAKGEGLPSAKELRIQLVTSFFSLGVGHLAATPFAALSGSIPGMGVGRFFAFSAGMVRGEDLATHIQGLPQNHEPFLVRFYEASLNAAFLEMGAKAGKPISEHLLNGYAEGQAKARARAEGEFHSKVESQTESEKLKRAQERFRLSADQLNDPIQLRSAFRRWIWEKRPDLATHERADEKADLQTDLELWQWLRQRAQNTPAPKQTPQKILKLGYDKDLSNSIEVVDLTHLTSVPQVATEATLVSEGSAHSTGNFSFSGANILHAESQLPPQHVMSLSYFAGISPVPLSLKPRDSKLDLPGMGKIGRIDRPSAEKDKDRNVGDHTKSSPEDDPVGDQTRNKEINYREPGIHPTERLHADAGEKPDLAKLIKIMQHGTKKEKEEAILQLLGHIEEAVNQEDQIVIQEAAKALQAVLTHKPLNDFHNPVRNLLSNLAERVKDDGAYQPFADALDNLGGVATTNSDPKALRAKDNRDAAIDYSMSPVGSLETTPSASEPPGSEKSYPHSHNLTRIEAWLAPPAIVDPKKIKIIESFVINHLSSFLTEDERNMATSILASGFFSTHILEYHQELAEAFIKINEGLEKIVRYYNADPVDHVDNIDQLEEALERIAKASRKVGKDDQSYIEYKIDEIRSLYQENKERLKEISREAQMEMEEQVEMAKIILIEVSRILAINPTDDFSMMLKAIRGLPIHIIPEIDEVPNGSYALSSFGRMLTGYSGQAVEVRIRPGATLSEFFHELLHAVDHEFHPGLLQDSVKKARDALQLIPVDKAENMLDQKTAIESAAFFEEATAFSGQAWFEGVLIKILGAENFRRSSYMSGSVDRESFVTRFEREGVKGIYEELRRNSSAYRLLELEKSWQFAALMSGPNKTILDQTFYTTEAGKWGLKVKKEETLGGTHYTFEDIDQPRALEKLAETDPTYLIRFAQQFQHDMTVKLTGGGGQEDENRLDSLEKFSISAAPLDIAEGNRDAITHDSAVTQDRVSLLTKFRELADLSSTQDVAHFEALLAIAEQVPSVDAPYWYERAAKLVRDFNNKRDYELSIELAAHLGGSLIDRGYEAKGKEILYEVLSAAIATDWFSSRKTELEDNDIEYLKDSFPILDRILRRLSISKGSDVIIEELFRFAEALGSYGNDYKLGEARGQILLVMDRFCDLIEKDHPRQADKIKKFVSQYIFTHVVTRGDKNTTDHFLPLLQYKNILRFKFWDDSPETFYFEGISDIVDALQKLPAILSPQETQLILSAIKSKEHTPVLQDIRVSRDYKTLSLQTPRGLLDFLDNLGTKGISALSGLSRVEEGEIARLDYMALVLGKILANRTEPELRSIGLNLLSSIPKEGLESYVVSSQGDGIEFLVPNPYSPMARLVMTNEECYFGPEGTFITEMGLSPGQINASDIFYFHRGYFQALAHLEKAHVDSANAPNELAAAEKLLKTADVKVKFADLPKVELLLHSLQKLMMAYLYQGDFVSAKRVFKKTTILMDEYEAQYRKMLQQGQAWFEKIDPGTPVGKWLSEGMMEGLVDPDILKAFPKNDPRRDLAQALVETFKKGAMSREFNSVGLRLKFKVYDAVLENRKGNSDKTFSKLIPEIKDEIEFRKGNLTTADLLELLNLIGTEPGLAKETKEIASICARHFALQRGESTKTQGDRANSKVGTIIKPLLDPLSEIDEDISDKERRREQIMQAGEELYETAEQMKREGVLINPDQTLWAGLEQFFEMIEKSSLSAVDRETAYLDLMERLLPRRTGDWVQLWDSFPQTFQGILSTLQTHNYPKVEAYLLRRLAGATPEMMFQPNKPGTNSSLLLAMSALSHFIAKTHPEILHPNSANDLLKVNEGLEYRMMLKTLLGDVIDPALLAEGTSGIEGFPYRMGEILTGTYRWETAISLLNRAISHVLDAPVSKGQVVSREIQELFRSYHELFRQGLLGKSKARDAKNNELFIEQTKQLVKKLITDPQYSENPIYQALVERLLIAEDPREAQVKRSWYHELLNLNNLTSSLEQKVFAGLHRAGDLSDYIYNRYITDYLGASNEIRHPFFEFVKRLAEYQSVSKGTPEDYFVVTLLEHPEKIDSTLSAYKLWIEAQKSQKPWKGDCLDSNDLAIFYYKVLPTLELRKKPTLDEFLVQVPIALGFEKGKVPSYVTSLWEIFDPPHLQNPGRYPALRKAIEEVKNNARFVEEQAQLRKLHLPSTVLELPSVIQFVAIRYLQKLSLGIREDILADFIDPTLTPEQAFRRMFEKTGNEKLGQFLSLMKGAMPEKFRAVLREFRGNVRGSRQDEIEAALHQAWGVAPEKRLAKFNYIMKKAGSIGEVYEGELAAGTEVKYYDAQGNEVTETLKYPVKVAVKILTSTRKKRLGENLKILKLVAQELKKQASRFGLRFDPVAVFEDFAKTFKTELDFRNEITNAQRYLPQLPAGLKMPRYFTNFSGPNIIVTEWVIGATPLDQVKVPSKKQEIFDKVAHMSASHILENGLYYEDPHTENVQVDQDLFPYLIDLGRLGVLEQSKRENLIQFFASVLKAPPDPKEVENALRTLTVSGSRPDQDYLNQLIRDIFALNGHGIEGLFKTVDELFKAAFEAGYYVRPEYTQVLKAFLTLEGVASEDPDIGSFEIGKYLLLPFMKAWQQLQK